MHPSTHGPRPAPTPAENVMSHVWNHALLDLQQRLANAQLILSDAYSRPQDVDPDGRTPNERIWYWRGVVDTYEFLVRELQARAAL